MTTYSFSDDVDKVHQFRVGRVIECGPPWDRMRGPVLRCEPQRETVFVVIEVQERWAE